jgi:uncharacterized protein YcsI (UPF0317 family)
VPDAPTTLTPSQARALFRAGQSTQTSGWCAGYTQLNMISVPQSWALDMVTFALRNRQACPLVDVTQPGSTQSWVAPEADLRTDLPGYRVYVDGRLTGFVEDATDHWRADLVTLLIGCSLTFEWGLRNVGIAIRHEEAGRHVPMYRTTRQCVPVGPLHGPLVVSMRGVPAHQVDEAVRVSGRYPSMHGAPVHVGDPAKLGIHDIGRPDYGDEPVLDEGDVPVFWACGVTPQAVVEASGVPFAITHAPGQMLISDVPESTWGVS